MNEHRKLAAIMFTDIVGYSALTQKSEARAFALLQTHNDILRPLFQRFHGTEIKSIGDAFLVEFFSALDAVLCAIEIQTVLKEYNTTNTDPIQIRIGIHLGDIIIKDKDVFGDGVNIAARIEPVAVPGGICLSEDVARQVQNKIEYQLVPLPARQLKNIDMPVQLFAVQLPWIPPLNIAHIEIKKSEDHFASYPPTSIAVLPFANISANSHDEYFSEGMTEEIISSLSKLSQLDVIARTSAFKFKDKDIDTVEIGRQLKIGTILTGSVRQSQTKARISVRLIETATQKLLWSDDYNRDISDIFEVQSDIAMRVADALKIQLLSSERRQLAQSETENPESYRLYLLGRYHLNKRTGDDIEHSIEYFNQAVSLDAKFALAYTGLAEAYVLMAGANYGKLPRTETIAQAKLNSLRAIELNDSLAEGHAVLAYVKYRLEWNWGEAEKEFQRAISLKSSYARAHEWYGFYLALLGRGEEGKREMKRALELDPLSPSVITGMARICYYQSRYDEAIAEVSRMLVLDPRYADAQFALCQFYLVQGDYKSALTHVQLALEYSGRRSIVLSILSHIYVSMGDVRTATIILDELVQRNAEPYILSVVYHAIGEKTKMYELLNKACEEREGLLVYLKVEHTFDDVKDEPQFQEILKKVGLLS
jgi:adenylate cyclase